jgi:diguanylate cyclase
MQTPQMGDAPPSWNPFAYIVFVRKLLRYFPKRQIVFPTHSTLLFCGSRFGKGDHFIVTGAGPHCDAPQYSAPYWRLLVLHRSLQPLREMAFRLLRYPSSSIEHDAVAGRIRAEQIGNIKRYLSSMMLANVCNASILVAALWASPQRHIAIAWASTILIFVAYYGLWRRQSARVAPSYVSPRVITRAVRNALLLGTLWAILPMLFFSDAPPSEQIIITALCVGMLAGGAFAFASVPAAAIAFTLPIVIASAVILGRGGDSTYLMLMLLMISYIGVLWRGVFVHASQMAKRVAAQCQAEIKVRRDELTSLPNRLAFFEHLESAFQRFEQSCDKFAILYLDLNDFKAVNDRCGHATGDRLLVLVGQRLKDCVREIDLVARLSGDEFALVVANITNSDAVTELANRIIRSLDIPFEIDGTEVFTGACIGIAFAPADGRSPELLLKRADEALYDAKRRSDGTIQLYDSSCRDFTRRRRSLERDLRDALRRHEFFLLFQPILSLDNNRITGFETLLRWQHRALGVKAPIEFTAILEESGLIHEVGHWVLVEACKAAVAWPEDIRVAVNVSPIQLRHTRILFSIVNALAVSNLRPERLEIEITETAIIDDSEQVLSNLNALRELGIRIALDDFGTGYSSLTYLRKISPDSIKIDASFVREVTSDAGCESIVKSLLKLSRDLNLKVVAEGIETAEQLNYLQRHHCEEGQGFYIGEPMAANEIAAFLPTMGAARISAA